MKEFLNDMYELSKVFLILILAKVVLEILSQYQTYQPCLYKKRITYKEYILLGYEK